MKTSLYLSQYLLEATKTFMEKNPMAKKLNNKPMMVKAWKDIPKYISWKIWSGIMPSLKIKHPNPR